MKKEKLAIDGGKPEIKKVMIPYRTIGEEEIKAANRVLESGILSGFIGASGEGFLGGKEVRALENEACEIFNVKNVISVNSWTSGLIAAIGAIGIEPGDEIITTPWTMVASATAILHWNAIPVFADISPSSFNIDPAKVEKLINSRTKAILSVDIFGLSSDMKALRELANKYNLKLISDTAQSPGLALSNNSSKLEADIGGFSLNYHKHIHCGEGGLIITDNDLLAERMRLIRNHGEAVINSTNKEVIKNILGYNFRLGEIESAIAREQLKKLKKLIKSRQNIAKKLIKGLKDLNGLLISEYDNKTNHTYYVLGMILETNKLSRDREWIIKALEAEGLNFLMKGYQNIHLNPIFKNRIAYGSKGFPWKGLNNLESKIFYTEGLCPVAEVYHNEKFIGLPLCSYLYDSGEIQSIICAFKKVWSHL